MKCKRGNAPVPPQSEKSVISYIMAPARLRVEIRVFMHFASAAGKCIIHTNNTFRITVRRLYQKNTHVLANRYCGMNFTPSVCSSSSSKAAASILEKTALCGSIPG